VATGGLDGERAAELYGNGNSLSLVTVLNMSGVSLCFFVKPYENKLICFVLSCLCFILAFVCVCFIHFFFEKLAHHCHSFNFIAGKDAACQSPHVG